MCGIVGYVGRRNGVPMVISGLRRLEYRGYDSAGIAVQENGKLLVSKHKGKIDVLENALMHRNVKGNLAIGHTRWATHGSPSKRNAHPHVNTDRTLAVVHNGIIENHSALRELLQDDGVKFRTGTDTEVLAHLIDRFFKGNLEEAVRIALSKVVGAYGVAVVSSEDPGKIVAARHGPPLVVGVGKYEYFLASDVAALLEFTRKVVYLEDGDIAIVNRDSLRTIDSENITIDKEVQEIDWSLEKIEKGGYKHFMLKEIHEQPATLRDSIRGRLDKKNGTAVLGGLQDHLDVMLSASQIYLTACGTSYHAAMIGESYIERLAGIPVEVEYASEFRYKDPIIDDNTVVVAISQSGETADTLAAVQMAKEKGATVLGICNVVGSTIARATEGGVYIHAGPEIGVASTKAFTSQVTVFMLLALALGRKRGLSLQAGRNVVTGIENLPDLAAKTLESSDGIRKIARKYKNALNFLYLGRGFNYPVALEGALKMKEISYIHAEGYPAAEMKHGPIALIDEKMPVVCLALRDKTYEKILSNIEEVKARKGSVIAVATEGDTKMSELADRVIEIPEADSFLSPVLGVIPLQLLAYHIAVLRGCDIDQPRNLAKSVTVE